MDATERQTPSSLWVEAERERASLELATWPDPEAAAAAVRQALSRYAACGQALDARAVFSPNESLDDLPTSSLPYLLLEFHVAALTLRLPAPAAPPAPGPRLAILRAARAALERYLARLDAYGLLAPPYATLYARYVEDPRTLLAAAATPAAARRDAKIASFRSERALRQRLDALVRSQRPPNPAADDDGDECERAVRLADVALHAHVAFQDLEGIEREEKVLAQAPAALPTLCADAADQNADLRLRERTGGDGFDVRLQPLAATGPLLTRDGKPLQPFTLVSQRDELRRGVFRPGHNLPTMSIDEFLAEERRRGGIIDGGGEASLRPAPPPDEDDHALADLETAKAREWDDFKEDNPRGWGNTLNRG